ncbi:AAA family ATPase [Myroides sp. M-43]|uniref:McrB family protein n=1 Tax=Myroides oncorhynchi TaxID=2893756 RepID=UPI001E582891|nr:AAA family ATPase [Myroides oncorhynchi]MCC9043719.1 AAA family ATPase [Myroides oncorhynchi]
MEEGNKKIWEEALQYAFTELDKKGWMAKNNGRYYFVVNEGKEYPNKKVLHYVEKYFHKKKVKLIVPSSANNGERLNVFLANNGAEVISKKESFISSCIREQSDVIKKLIEDYKKQIKSGALKYEEYKWLLFTSQKGMPSLQKSTIVDELLSIKFVNLLYYSAISTMKHLNKDRKDQYSDLLLGLYDENIDIEERIKQFSGGIESLYREVETKLQHHHDERTISTLLSFKYPEKYLLFKNSFYQKLCNLLEMESLDKGEKYLDYLEIAEEIRDSFIKTDTELLSLVKQYLPEGSYDDPNYNLLTQDFLYTMLEKSNDYYDQFKKVKKLFNDKLKSLENSSITYKERNGKDFQWVQDKYGIIGNEYIHYELYCDKSSIYIDLHLEDEAQSKEITLLLKELYIHLLNKKYDSELVSWIDWVKETNSKDYIQSIRFYKAFSLDEEDILEEQSISEMIQSFVDLDDIIGDDIREFLIKNNQVKEEIAINYVAEKNMNHPLNQILYGPPGTGKTYTLQNKFFDTFTKREITITKEEYVKSIIQELSWWQVITLVVLEIKKGKVNDIYEHEYIKVKEQFSKSKTVVPTIWGQLQAHTLLKCPNVNVEKRQEPLYFWKDENSNWSIEKEDLESSYSEIIDIQERVNNYTPERSVTIKNYEFVTFHQSFTYEDFIEGIKPDLEDNTGGEIKYRIKDGVFKTICKKAQKDPENRYALFIDEINRGNVSAIFGELITLIEESKRLGNEEALEVTLPYSKEKFGVPNNLHIIGTMNTADRSVEALDTALRRRFTFEEMMPNYDVIKTENSFGIDLSKLLRTINDRIEVLLDRDHLIGHSYFLHVDSLETLQSRFRDNIIPLLQEYFYGDYGKMGLLLGEGFVTKKEGDKVVFASFDYDSDMYSEKSIYNLKSTWEEGEFREAISKLLGIKV